MFKLSALVALFALTACVSPAPHLPAEAPADPFAPQPYVQVEHADWAHDAVIYQINMRQFTPEGTFAAAQEKLPDLHDLGVDILWLMPIQPIGEINRKGRLGSPYSIRDYYGINPEFGTEAEFKAFVSAAHEMGFKVILDWVANHSAWDNALAETHPDWYETDWQGQFMPPPWTGWDDVIELDYDQPGLRQYMSDAMVYWVSEVDLDGFRCDVAGYVPLDFWETARSQLGAIKPVFMLAEWQQRDLHQHAFDATYGWAWKETAQRIAKGEADAGAMTGYLQAHIATWPHDGYRMLYTENHDQNAWEGTTQSLYGDAYDAFLTLSFVTEGIPLIHNGQEVANQKALNFFDRDPIDWSAKGHPDETRIKTLIKLRKDNRALWNGAAGGRTIPVVTDNPAQIVSFARQVGDNKILVLANLSPSPASAALRDGPVAGHYIDLLSQEAWTLDLQDNATLDIAAWNVLVLRQIDTE